MTDSVSRSVYFVSESTGITAEAYGQYTRDELDQDSVDLVEEQRQFQSQDSAANFVAQRLHPRSETADDADTTGTSSSTTTTSDPGSG